MIPSAMPLLGYQNHCWFVTLHFIASWKRPCDVKPKHLTNVKENANLKACWSLANSKQWMLIKESYTTSTLKADVVNCLLRVICKTASIIITYVLAKKTFEIGRCTNIRYQQTLQIQPQKEAKIHVSTMYSRYTGTQQTNQADFNHHWSHPLYAFVCTPSEEQTRQKNLFFFSCDREWIGGRNEKEPEEREKKDWALQERHWQLAIPK